MQEEVEQKSLTLTVNAAKMTARLFRTAIAKYVAHRKEKKHDAQTGVRYVGRQSVKKLVGQNQGVSNVELSGEDIKAFERVARKYGVDYAVKKVKGDAPRFLIFFKARDVDAPQCGAVRIHQGQKMRGKEHSKLREKLRAPIEQIITHKKQREQSR